jgi:hypothetical protein
MPNQKANEATNHKANWKVNHNADCIRRAKTPEYMHDDWDLDQLGLDDELKEAKKAPDDLDDDADEDSPSRDGEDDIDIKAIATGDLAAMKILAMNRSLHGTTAARLARGAQKAKAAPGWTGTVADYEAWVEALRQAPGSPEAALNPRAPKQAYLAILNGAKHFSVLHHLHQWKAPDRVRSHIEGCIVAFEGEVWDKYCLPFLWRFDKNNEDLLQLVHLPAICRPMPPYFTGGANGTNGSITKLSYPPRNSVE